MLTLPAKMGEGGRIGALSGAERAPLPPSILREALTVGGRGVLAEPARPSHRGPGTRRAASAGAGGTHEPDAKRWTRELASDGLSWAKWQGEARTKRLRRSWL
jgi:hypothetical protein